MDKKWDDVLPKISKAARIQDHNTYISSLTQGECSEESNLGLVMLTYLLPDTRIKADHPKIVTFIDESAGCQRKSRNPLEGEIISIRGPEGLVLIIPGKLNTGE